MSFVLLLLVTILSSTFEMPRSSFSGTRYQKARVDPLLKDNNVESVAHNSIIGGFLYAINRFASGHIYPYVELVWSFTFGAIFDVTYQCWLYLKDFMWNNIYATFQWIYANTISPVLICIQENIYYLAQFIMDGVRKLFNDYVYLALKAGYDFIYDYVYLVIVNWMKVIWNNIVWLFDCIMQCIRQIGIVIKDILYQIVWYVLRAAGKFCAQTWTNCVYVSKMMEGFVEKYGEIALKFAYEYVFKPLGEILGKLWTNCIDYVVKSYESIRQCVKGVFDSIYGIVADFFDKYGEMIYNKIFDAFEFVWDNMVKVIDAVIDTVCLNNNNVLIKVLELEK